MDTTPNIKAFAAEADQVYDDSHSQDPVNNYGDALSAVGTATELVEVLDELLDELRPYVERDWWNQDSAAICDDAVALLRRIDAARGVPFSHPRPLRTGDKVNAQGGDDRQGEVIDPPHGFQPAPTGSSWVRWYKTEADQFDYLAHVECNTDLTLVE